MRRAGTLSPSRVAAAGGDAGGQRAADDAREPGGGEVGTFTGLVSSDWVQEALYESQRGFYFAGRFKFSSNALLPFDPPQWTTTLGTPLPARPKHLQVPFEDVWEWATEWLVDMSFNCDRDGWQYAFAFFAGWHAICGGLHRFVRRRRWVRFRRIKPQTMILRSAREDTDAARDTEENIMVASATGSATPSEQVSGQASGCLRASAETLTNPSSVAVPAKDAVDHDQLAGPSKARFETAEAGSSPAVLWRRLMKECRVDRERLAVLCCLSEAAPAEVVSRLDDCLAILDYNRSRAAFLRSLLEASKDARRRVSEEGTPERQEVERRLAFFSYWTELGIGA